MDSHIYYVPSQRMTRQGKADEINKQYRKEWNISPRGGGNGNWLLTKPSNVLFNGKSCRSFVLEYYNGEKLTKGLVDKFREDVKNGNISLDDIYYD